MKTVFSVEIDSLLKIGKSLNSVGVSNWALNRSQALYVLENFLLLQIPVLGGDVYEYTKGTMRTNYDNWYCDPYPQEEKKKFVIRSIAKSKAYIETYTEKDLNNLFFVVVPDVL